MPQIDQDIEFVLEVDRLKNVARKTRNVSNERYENDAEHSWHVCIMAIALQKYSNRNIGILKVLQMLLVHDLGEIYCGDTIVYGRNNEDKQKELESATKLFSMLGPIRQAELANLIQEFEERKTDEAKYANAIDRMEPILQNICNGGETWKKYKITYERIMEVNRGIVSEGSEELWNFLLTKIDLMKKDSLF